MKFESGLFFVVAVVGENVEEGADEVEVVAGDVRDLEDGADAPRDELRCCIDALLAVGDEDGDFPRAGGFEDFGELGDGLLEDLGRTDVDFGDDDHDGDVEREGDTQMFFGHADQPIIGSYHQQAIIWLGREQAEDSGAEVFLVAGQVGEANDFRRSPTDLLPGEFSSRDGGNDNFTFAIETLARC